jgi:cytochrome c556
LRNLFREHRMRSFLCAASVAVLLTVAGWVGRPADGASEDEEKASIKKIMQTLHKGDKAPIATLKDALKSESPDWAQVQKDAKLIAKYGALLPKNEPPRGGKASFEKLAKAYAANAKSLEEAAGKEDLKGAREASKKLGSACMTCHQAHKAAS